MNSTTEYFAKHLFKIMMNFVRESNFDVDSDTASIVKDMVYEKLRRQSEIDGKVMNSVIAEIKKELFNPTLLKEKKRKARIEKKQNAINKICDLFAERGIHSPNRTYIKSLLERSNWSVDDALSLLDREEEVRLGIPGIPFSREGKIRMREQQNAIERINDLLVEKEIRSPNQEHIRRVLELSRWNVRKALSLLEREEKERVRKTEALLPHETRTGTLSKPKRSKKSYGKGSEIDSAIRVTELETELTKLKRDLLATTDKLIELKKTTGMNAGQDQQKPEDIVDFYFEIFPPGEWKSKDFTQHYKDLVRQGKYREREVQWERIREIEKLNPQSRYKGKQKWLGYVVFDFAYTNNVVLECPIEGNAIYILKGSEWKNLIRLTKGEIRDNHVDSYKKVVHKNDWLSRVETALHNL